MSRRVILDTSTLVSAALRIGSIPYRTLQQALGAWDVCASMETLDELHRVLEKKKFDRYQDQSMRRDFVTMIRRNVHLFSIQPADVLAVHPSCRDPEDDKFLALAMAVQADVIVSSDEDLLVLHPWRGILVMTPAEFLAHFNAK